MHHQSVYQLTSSVSNTSAEVRLYHKQDIWEVRDAGNSASTWSSTWNQPRKYELTSVQCWDILEWPPNVKETSWWNVTKTNLHAKHWSNRALNFPSFQNLSLTSLTNKLHYKDNLWALTLMWCIKSHPETVDKHKIPRYTKISNRKKRNADF
jgi:hypothetical protein